MRHPERVEDYLEHIAKAIERATEYVGRFHSLSAFQQSQLEQDAETGPGVRDGASFMLHYPAGVTPLFGRLLLL